jgi:hypothetical protein
MDLNTTSLLATSGLLLALGFRHGLDPDHIAVVDGMTRLRHNGSAYWKARWMPWVYGFQRFSCCGWPTEISSFAFQGRTITTTLAALFSAKFCKPWGHLHTPWALVLDLPFHLILWRKQG